MAHKETATVHFSCACKQASGSVEVPISRFPLPMSLCHCNICRHQTGLLGASYVTLPEDQRTFEVHGTTTAYKTSKVVLRHFCNICGSNLVFEEKEPLEISLCSGAITSSGIEPRLKRHIFVGDTKDGGMSSWLPSVQGWEGFSNKSEPVDCGRRLPEQSETNVKSTSSELPGYCQCRNVQFRITRPNEKSSDLHGQFADLLVPYVSCSPEKIGNRGNVKWWLRRQGSRYLAGACACNSCRTNSGFDIQTWTFIPKVNLFDTHGRRLDIETMQGLTEYKSSEGVYRHFCSHCGATVFWRCDTRPDLIDVSVGLLDAEEGVRAESWLTWWTDRISFEEDAPSRTLIANLKNGLKRWGDQTSSQEQ